MHDNNHDNNIEEKDEIRLQVFLAHCGVASRRASEKIIAEGRVKVNGNIVTEPGVKVSLTDKIEVDGNMIFLEAEKRYVLLNKPQGYICANSDDRGRLLASDLLKEKYSERLYSVGRLDLFSRGLIIFTNDGDFAKILSHPSSELEKEYIVESSTDLPWDLCEKFQKGIRIDNVFYKAKSCEELNARKIKVVLIEGKNREIRRVFDDFGVGIKALTRIRIGNVLIGDLAPGQYRDLTKAEIENLLNVCKK